MLTQDQKDKLHQLMNDCPISNLKKVLEVTIPRWISGEIIPIQGSLGLLLESLNGKWKADNNKCCLLGTAFVGESVDSDSEQLYSLSYSDTRLIALAFDNRIGFQECEMTNYVKQIRIVIFGK